MILHSGKELFDFAVNVMDVYEKVKSTGVTIITMAMPHLEIKYSLKLRPNLPQLVMSSEQREILFNPVMAGLLSPVIVVHSIIWAIVRPDFDNGSKGDNDADATAIDIINSYYSDFNRSQFLEDLSSFINRDGKNEARLKAAKAYIETLPTS